MAPGITLLLPSATAYGFVGTLFTRSPWFGPAVHALYWFGVFAWSYYASTAVRFSMGAVEAALWMGVAVGVMFVLATGIPELLIPSASARATPWKNWGDFWPYTFPGLFTVLLGGALLAGGWAMKDTGFPDVSDNAKTALIVVGIILIVIGFLGWAIAHYHGDEMGIFGRTIGYFFALLVVALLPAIVYEQSVERNWFGGLEPNDQVEALGVTVIAVLVAYFVLIVLSVCLDARQGVWRYTGIFEDESGEVAGGTEGNSGYGMRVGTFFLALITHFAFYLAAGFAVDAENSVENVLFWLAVAAAIAYVLFLLAWLFALYNQAGNRETYGWGEKYKRTDIKASYGRMDPLAAATPLLSASAPSSSSPPPPPPPAVQRAGDPAAYVVKATRSALEGPRIRRLRFSSKAK
jgi:uncharacterized membrane protein YiaA